MSGNETPGPPGVTAAGIPLRPFYGPGDGPRDQGTLGDPGTYPFTRGRLRPCIGRPATSPALTPRACCCAARRSQSGPGHRCGRGPHHVLGRPVRLPRRSRVQRGQGRGTPFPLPPLMSPEAADALLPACSPAPRHRRHCSLRCKVPAEQARRLGDRPLAPVGYESAQPVRP
jgi:hypothetical protein